MALPKIFDYRCRSCGKRFEEVLYSDEPQPKCPDCGDDTDKLIGAPATDLFSQNLYPYFNRGLGCMVNSKEHLRQICKERGLTPIESSTDDAIDLAAQRRKVEEEEKDYNDYMDRLEHAPEFREYREMRDKGAYDTIKKVREGTFKPYRPE